MSMLIEPLFSDFLAREIIDLDHAAIADYCLELDQTQEASRTGLPIVLQGSERPLQPLYSKVKEKFNEVHTKLSLSSGMYQEVMGSWINVNHSTSPQEPHAHDDFPYVMFTAVYYPKVEKVCSNIHFLCSNPARKFVMFQKFLGPYNHYNASEWFITPQTGDLIIFPAWMLHYVAVNKRNPKEQRISIAFNSKISFKRV